MNAPARPRAVKVYSGHPRLGFQRAAIQKVIATLDAAAADKTDCDRGHWHAPAGEFSVAFLTDPALARLHADFMNDPSATDVITFPAPAGSGLGGEVCISVDTAKKYAVDHDRPFSEELTLYLVHGYLHLCGYDDLAPKTRKQMRGAERRAMAVLKSAKVLPEFSFGR